MVYSLPSLFMLAVGGEQVGLPSPREKVEKRDLEGVPVTVDALSMSRCTIIGAYSREGVS